MSGRGLTRRRGGWTLPALGLAAGLAGWHLLGVLAISPAVPRVDDVAAALVEVVRQARFHDALGTTLGALAIGFPIACATGIGVGLAMGLSKWVEWALMPYLYLALSLPLIVVIPVILLVFGFGRLSVVVVILVYVVPFLVTNTMAGVHSVDAQLEEMTASFGADRALVIRRLVLPSALSLTLSGLRIGAGRAIEGAILAEMLLGLMGLGGLVLRLGGAFAVEELFAVVLCIGALGIVAVGIIDAVERAWLRDGRALV